MENHSKKQIKEFVQDYEKMCKLGERFSDLRVGDVFVDENNMLIPNSLEAIERYKEGVPIEFGENSDSVRKIDIKMSKL